MVYVKKLSGALFGKHSSTSLYYMLRGLIKPKLKQTELCKAIVHVQIHAHVACIHRLTLRCLPLLKQHYHLLSHLRACMLS